MSHKSAPPTVSTIGIDLGKNSFHLVGLDQRGAIRRIMDDLKKSGLKKDRGVGRRSLRHPSIRCFVSPPVWRTRAPQHAALFPPYDECPSESSQDVSEARKATGCGIPCWTTCLPLHRTSDDAFQARAVVVVSAHDVHRVWLYSEIALRPSLSENAFFSKNLGTRNQFAVQVNFVRV